VGIETVFYLQVGSILAFLILVFALYRLLVSSKDATIETLKQQVSFLEGKVKAASDAAPDVLILRQEKRVTLLTKELEAAENERRPLLTELEELRQKLSIAESGVSSQLLAANEVVARRSSLESALRRAIDREEFVLAYQPQLSLTTGLITGVEALIRWNKPDTGVVGPSEFIPILEDSGMIVEVDRWVLHQAAEAHLSWHRRGLTPVRIAINISAMQVHSRSFVAEVEGLISRDERLKNGLELEITETALLVGVDGHISADLQKLRALGVHIAIDDFGTGYSSLSYLQRLPLDRLKIDRSFIHDVDTEATSQTLASAIINIAQSLNLNVIAEGVETKEQSRLLQFMKCDEIQGNVVDRPLAIRLLEQRYFLKRDPAN